MKTSIDPAFDNPEPAVVTDAEGAPIPEKHRPWARWLSGVMPAWCDSCHSQPSTLSLHNGGPITTVCWDCRPAHVTVPTS